MTETIDFARQVEHDLQTCRTIGASTFQSWDALSPSAKAAFGPALSFLGGTAHHTSNGQSAGATEEADRVAACRLMLLALFVDQDEPAWSSFLLERMLEAVMTPPGGSVGDLFHALYDILADHRGAPSQALANLIKQLVILCFTRQRPSYDAVDWQWFADQASRRASPGQLYFAMYALPQKAVNEQLSRRIQSTLAASPFQAEASAALSE